VLDSSMSEPHALTVLQAAAAAVHSGKQAKDIAGEAEGFF
jgi:hypothetical protein